LIVIHGDNPLLVWQGQFDEQGEESLIGTTKFTHFKR
jgi:hypothetical protein